MKIISIDNTTIFGMKFKLSNKTLSAISQSTGLTVDELHSLSMDEATKLMKERRTLKEPNKLKLWLADKYKQFGERTGLLKKYVNIYTDVD